MSRQVGVYFESWISSSRLESIPESVNTVYLAFCKPDATYIQGSNNFYGSGLEFSISFSEVVTSIGNLKNRGVKVFLAVGGGAYWHGPKVFTSNCIDLMKDLGCTGIDIDWEVGAHDALAPANVIRYIRQEVGNDFKISFTCFSTGAYPKVNGDRWRGMNIHALQNCGHLVDFVNVMGYDAGPDFDEIATLKAYRRLYKGIINIGFEVGRHGWGTAILYKEEAIRNLDYVINEQQDGGCFIWAFKKSGSPGIEVSELTELAFQKFKPVAPKPVTPFPKPYVKPTYSCPSSVYVLCPNCDHRIKLAVSDGGPKV